MREWNLAGYFPTDAVTGADSVGENDIRAIDTDPAHKPGGDITEGQLRGYDITGIAFGPEAGFLTGALSAVISNFYFGQGPWTPFQMFSWGILGFIAGLLAAPLKKSRIALTLYAVLSGVLYSFLMDIWTVLWADGAFNFSRYLAAILSAAPFTAIYAVSNTVFLWLFARPIGKILDRLKTKYAL